MVKKLFLSICLFILTSCESSDVIVNIYGYSEYNCTKDEYKILKQNSMLSFLKINKWYNREEFHNVYSKDTLEPWKGLPISEETLANILPTIEMSNEIFNELIIPVDCDNPKDIKY